MFDHRPKENAVIDKQLHLAEAKLGISIVPSYLSIDKNTDSLKATSPARYQAYLEALRAGSAGKEISADRKSNLLQAIKDEDLKVAREHEFKFGYLEGIRDQRSTIAFTPERVPYAFYPLPDIKSDLWHGHCVTQVGLLHRVLKDSFSDDLEVRNYQFSLPDAMFETLHTCLAITKQGGQEIVLDRSRFFSKINKKVAREIPAVDAELTAAFSRPPHALDLSKPQFMNEFSSGGKEYLTSASISLSQSLVYVFTIETVELNEDGLIDQHFVIKMGIDYVPEDVPSDFDFRQARCIRAGRVVTSRIKNKDIVDNQREVMRVLIGAMYRQYIGEGERDYPKLIPECWQE